VIIERALVVLVLFALGFIAYRFCVRCQVQRAAAAAPVDPLLAGQKNGVPTIVYFTTPTCAPCRFQQTPVLEQLAQEMGDERLRLIRVDATADPAAAARWGVFSVPTLFVLDAAGQPRRVFNGVVGLEQLKQELVAS
jgi:thioredoxin 1